MYRIKEVYASGLHRFGESVIELPTDDSIWMIIGRNLDSNGSDSNGAGKSAFFNIISFALMGAIPGKGAEVLTVDGGGKGSARVLLQDMESKSMLEVIRQITKSGTKLTVIVDGNELDVSGEGVRKPQEVLNSYLGFPDASRQSFDAFLNVTYLTFNEVRGFADIATTSADRISLMTKYLGLDELEVVLKTLREQKREYDKEIRGVESSFSEIDRIIIDVQELKNTEQECATEIRNGEQKIDTYQKELFTLPDVEKILSEEVELRRRLEVVNRREVNELVPLRASYDNLIEKYDQISEFESLLHKIKDVENTDSIQIKLDDVTTESTAVNNELVRARIATKQSLAELQRLENTPKGQPCPNCEQQLIFVNNVLIKFDVEGHRELIEQKNATYEEFKLTEEYARQACTDIDDRFRELRQQYNEALSIKGERSRLEKEIVVRKGYGIELEKLEADGTKLSNELQAEREAILVNIDTICGDLEPHTVNAKKKELNLAIDAEKNKVSKFKGLILQVRDTQKKQAEYQNRKDVLNAELGKISKQIEIVVKAATEVPKFRVVELEKAIPQLESLANDNLREFGSEFRLRFDLTVGARTEFVIMVSDESGVWRGFGTYSSGERQRVALACALAQCALTQGMGGFLLDFTMMDEVFDGLDTEGKNALLQYLQNNPSQYFMITHGTMNDMVPNAICVTRENDESSFGLLN